jgi:MraZ protein
MPQALDLILGEHRRTLDERYRVAIPLEMCEQMIAGGKPGSGGDSCTLAKERVGCLSLWNTVAWQEKLDEGVQLVKGKIRAGRLEGKTGQVQMLGRLLSTRHQQVQLAGRGRLLIPEPFRNFLHAESGSDVVIVGAAVCIEIWHPDYWLRYVERRMPRFRRLFDTLSG